MTGESKSELNSPSFQPRFRKETVLAAGALFLAALLAYSSSFAGKFIFDDDIFVKDLQAHSFWEFLLAPKSLPRPLVSFTLALNYAFGGLDVAGYHAFNLAVHFLAALVLFGLVRRTLRLESLRERFGLSAGPLALAAALLWLVHPLQTESVTYIVQRAESLAGLFYLLTVYCLLRGAECLDLERGLPARQGWRLEWPHSQKCWCALAVVSCALGMACKPTMATAPLAAFAYDRIFLAGSCAAAWRMRWKFYAAMAATWLLLAALVFVSPSINAGFGMKALTPADYALTQPGVILHYLRLSFWPAGLCLDYMWPMARQAGEILPGVFVVGALAGATLWAWFRRPAWSFSGIWFFVILAPTSSFMPILDPAFEHRMYLPLAAPAVLAVIGAYLLGQACLRRLPRVRGLLSVPVAVVLVVPTAAFLGFLTFQRNKDYHDRLAMWRDVLDKRPRNWRAHYNVGYELIMLAKDDESLAYFDKALEINPWFVNAYGNRGLVRYQKGEYDLAMADFARALALEPESDETYYNRGLARCGKREYSEALADFTRALELNPRSLKARFNRGNVRYLRGDYDGALEDCNLVLKLDPDHAEALNNRGLARCAKGDYNGAIEDFTRTLLLNPRSAQAYCNRGNARYEKDDYDGALADFDKALELDPRYANAYYKRSLARCGKGDFVGAIVDCDKALELDPQAAEIYHGRGNARFGKGDYEEAVADFTRALELDSRYCEAFYNRGVACWSQGKYGQAEADFTRALELNPKSAEIWNNRGKARFGKGDFGGALKDYGKALELNPHYAEAYFDRGVARQEKGAYDEAIADYTKTVEIESSNWQAWINKGLLLLKAGRDADAQTCFDEGLKINPGLRSSLEDKIAQARAGRRITPEKPPEKK